MVRNPVMFVVEVGSVLTTLLFVQALFGQGEAPAGIHRRGCAVALVHRTVCEFFGSVGGGTRQGAGGLRCAKARRETQAKKLRNRNTGRAIHDDSFHGDLRKGDVLSGRSGRYDTADGEVIEGVASVDESAVTGEKRAR